MVQPLLLPVRRPFVAICGYGADDAGFVREVQTAKLTVFLYGLVSLFFEDCASLVMNLVCRSKPFGGGLDLYSTAYPHIHRQTKNRIRGELMQVYVEIPEDVDDGGMKGKPKPRKQEIAEDDNLIIAGLRYGLSARGSRGPDHAVLLK
jgi:hypothetical protein